MGGLIAIQEERAHLAGIHLLDEETGEYNYPYVKRVLPGREVAIVHLAYRSQGLMFTPGNPKRIKGIEDLKRPDITFVNRQQGAGTRVLLDIHLRQLGINPKDIKGYEQELDTHLAVGLSVAHGEADVALGIEAAARSCNIDFLPLFRERYDLVIPVANYRSELLAPPSCARLSVTSLKRSSTKPAAMIPHRPAPPRFYSLLFTPFSYPFDFFFGRFPEFTLYSI